MHSSDTISFHCPSCGVKLSVSTSAAGVVGPCPKCDTEIQAPELDVPEVVVSESEPTPVVAPQPNVEDYQPELLNLKLTEPEPVVSVKLSAVDAIPNSSDVESDESTEDQSSHQEETPNRPRRAGIMFPLAFLITAGAIAFVLFEAGGLTDLWGKKSSSAMPSGPIQEAVESEEDGEVKIPPLEDQLNNQPAKEAEAVLVKPLVEKPTEVPEIKPSEPEPQPVLVKPKKPKPAPKPPEGEFPDLLPPSVSD